MLKEIAGDKLLAAQKQLDVYTFTKRGLDYKITFKKRALALLVELHELANETKAFKFGSNTNEGDRDEVLMEYVDVLHFSLSTLCAREEGITGVGYYDDLEKKDVEFLTVYFLDLVIGFSRIVDQMFVLEEDGKSLKPEVSASFMSGLQKFVNLSGYLGYSGQEVTDAYWRKWNINVERQDSGKY